MLTGQLVNGFLVAVDGGLPVIETPPPELSPGYGARFSWSSNGQAITQQWEIFPLEGTTEAAVQELARIVATKLDDDDAIKVAALFPEWAADIDYSVKDKVRYEGKLYKCLQAHRSQADWMPVNAHSLWAEVLPGQGGTEAPWTQPDSTNGYSEGDVVTHNGKRWESTADNNVWEPGAVGASWRELKE